MKKVVMDFTKQYTSADIEKLFNEQLAGLDISVLHNNACTVVKGQISDLSTEDLH